MTVLIGGKKVGASGHCMVVAEIGINHNGDLDEAKKLIDMAVEAGCDAVKFQKRTIDVIYTPEERATPRKVLAFWLKKAIARGHLPADNVERLTKAGLDTWGDSDEVEVLTEDQKYMLELTREDYREIDEYCREKGILWFASPWDEGSVDFLEQFDPPCYKVASASLTDHALLRHMRATGRPIILSTGMADLDMIAQAVGAVGHDDLVLLHCTSVYPTFQHDGRDKGISLINLKGIDTLRAAFPGVPIGFSSHDLGIQPSYAAAVMGACMIEKHITIFRGMYGSDQGASIEEDDLVRLVRMIRELPVVMGDGMIQFYEEEKPVAKKLRRK